MAVRLTIVAALLALAAWAAIGHAEPAAKPGLTLADGAFSQSNSREGQAILNATGMAPGDSAEGTVTIANTGATAGGFTLVRGAVADTPGAAGGRLSDRLTLVVEDLSAGRTIYSGPLMSMAPPSVGRFSPGESHTFRFRVSFPEDGSPAVDNAYAGGSVSARFDWISEHDERPQPAPQPQPQPPTQPQPQPQPTPPTAAGAPRLTLRGASAQRVLRQGAAMVTAGCDQACTLRAGGSVSAARSLKLSPATASAPAGGTATLKVKLSRSAKRSLAALLKRGRKVKITVRVTATGAAGQSTSATRSVSVKR